MNLPLSAPGSAARSMLSQSLIEAASHHAPSETGRKRSVEPEAARAGIQRQQAVRSDRIHLGIGQTGAMIDSERRGSNPRERCVNDSVPVRKVKKQRERVFDKLRRGFHKPTHDWRGDQACKFGGEER